MAPMDDDGEIMQDEPGPVDGQEAAAEGGIQPPPEPHQDERPERRVRALPKPMTPTRIQREEHELTHIPMMPWCRHCVMSRSMSDQHRRKKKHVNDRDVPIISGDFCFMGQTEQDKASPMFVLRDHSTRMTFAHMVEGKSTVNQEYSDYLRKAVLQDIGTMGHSKIVFKTDGEPACKALQDAVKSCRDATTVIENSPPEESQSNGVVEKAIDEVEGMVRTLKSALEERLGGRLEPGHPVITWLVEWAATLINRYRVGKDGQTPDQRHKGRERCHRPIAEFGESVWYMPMTTATNHLNKMETRMFDGIWLGMESRDGSVRIGTASGVVKARTIRRKPLDNRWVRHEVDGIRGTTWSPTPGIQTEGMQAAVASPSDEQLPMAAPEENTELGMKARRTRLTPADFKRHGFTPHCDGCKAIREAKDSRNHNELCRRRMEEAIGTTEEGRERMTAGYVRVADADMRRGALHQETDQTEATADVDTGSGEVLPPADESGKTKPATPQPTRRPGRQRGDSSMGVAQYPRGEKRRGDGEDEELPHIFRKLEDSPPALTNAATEPQVFDIGTPPPVADANPSASSTSAWRPDSSWIAGQDAAMDSLSRSSRNQHMEVVRAKLGCQVDVAEVYSPPRVCAMAEEMGIRPGFSLDFTSPRADGMKWDFSLPRYRREAMELINRLRPYCVIGSPPCTAWSNLQNLNKCRPGGEAKVAEAQERAKVHLEFSVKVYRAQMRAGRYFVHEHPQTATSWKVPEIDALANSPMVMKAYANMCAFGMTSKDKEGEGPVLKPTVFMTNSSEVKKELSQKCRGCPRHVHLVEGRASAAQVYPPALCRAVCRGIINQAKLDAQDMMSVQCHAGKDEIHALDEICAVEHEANDWRKYWDDLSGKELNWELTEAARKEEIECIHQMGVYVKVPISQCIERTGKRPIGTRWVDVNKGDSAKPKVRSRLVAQELNLFKQPELFAATPPIEYIRFLVSCCASSQWTANPTRIMLQDVKKAYFFAPARREVYVQLPWEDRLAGEEEMCALLKKSLYGTRDAAANWTDEYTRVLTDVLGFVKGEASPCSFHHPTKNIKVVVHGDDFVSEACKADLVWFDKALGKHFELKTEVLGPDSGEVREVRILNRVLRWEKEGITWEADQRHAELVVEQLGLEKSKPVSSPGSKEDARREGMTERKRNRMITEADEESDNVDCIYNMVDGEEPQMSAVTRDDIEQIMIADGWEMKDVSGLSWIKSFQGSRKMQLPPAGTMCRRTTRTSDGRLIEDLKIDSKTSDKLLQRQLRKPQDVDVEVEINEVDEVPKEDDDIPLVGLEQSKYRAVVARINFLAQDRVELLFAAKECSRHMSAPCRGDMGPLKRIGRFLLGRPRSVVMYKWQDAPTSFTVYTDSNWAGCKGTRKSTSGATFMHGGHLLKAFSRTQANIALSSAEAELYATVLAASEGLGMKAMARDFAMTMSPYLNVDASAAIGIVQRKGLGKLRHLDTQSLWIQDAVRQRRVMIEKVKGTENPADLMTKHLDGPAMNDMLQRIGIQTRSGRAVIAPDVVKNNIANIENTEYHQPIAQDYIQQERFSDLTRGVSGGARMSVSWADDSES